VGLHRILGNEELLPDLAVAQPLSDQGQDLVLTWGEADLLQFLSVGREGAGREEGGRDFPDDVDFLDDDDLLRARSSQSEVDAEEREDDSDQAAVDLGGIFVDEVLVLDELQQGDENAANGSVERDLSGHRGEQSNRLSRGVRPRWP
jgi:hypothetical protein